KSNGALITTVTTTANNRFITTIHQPSKFAKKILYDLVYWTSWARYAPVNPIRVHILTRRIGQSVPLNKSVKDVGCWR
ncbi:hypothetical protein WG66_007836, partial [Moniliophthora roreri]